VPEYLTPAQLVKRWGGAVSLKTLANWRSGEIKYGPKFWRPGRGANGTVLYYLDSVEDYEKENADALMKGR